MSTEMNDEVIATAPETVIDTRQQIINDAREMINWLEAHPEVNLPFEMATSPVWTIYNLNKEKILTLVKAFGTCEKAIDDTAVEVSRSFGSLTLRGYTDRSNVCERIVVGTEEVPERTIPAQPEKVIPATTREIVEWRCDPILANGNGHKAEEKELAVA